MASGVRPLGGKAKARSKRPLPAPPAARPAPAPAPRAAAPRPAAAPTGPDPRDLKLAELRAKLEERDRLIAGSEASAAGSAATIAELEGRLERLPADRDGVERRRIEQAARLAVAEEALAAADAAVPIGELLRRRGLTEGKEDFEALSGLLELRSNELVASLGLADGDAVARLLDERVALVCGREDCRPAGTVVSVHVAPGRCEICGGSDIRAAFRRFVASCAKAQVSSIVIVGGSPPYRRQLRALADDQEVELRLDLVSGTTRRPKHKAQADLRRADLVVMWGATLLDHSVNEAYRGGPARLLRVAHRGITRMLEEVRRDVLATRREARTQQANQKRKA